MSNKIPVGAVIAQSYRFAFQNFVNNLAASWIPLAILFVVSYFFMQPYMNLMTQMASPPAGADQAASLAAAQANLAVIGQLLPYMLLFLVASVVCLSSATVGITGEALGLRKDAGFIPNPFGKSVWRLICAMLLLFAIGIGCYIVTIIAGVILGFILGLLGSAFGKAAVGILIVLEIFACLAAFIYVFTRLSFLVAPVVVAENRISVKRSWELTGGNFWRLVACVLALLIPLFILEIVYIYAVLGPEYFAMFDPTVPVQERMAHNQEIMKNMMGRMTSLWYIVYPIGLLLYVVLLGLFNGLAAFAYRALTGPEVAEF